MLLSFVLVFVRDFQYMFQSMITVIYQDLPDSLSDYTVLNVW